MKKILFILLLVPVALFGQNSLEDLLQNTTLNDGLIAFYDFNGSSNDVSGNGNHGVAYEAQLTYDRFGTLNSSYNFDISDGPSWGGADDRINVNFNPIMNSSEISLSAWVKPNYKNPPFHNRPLTICSRWTIQGSEVFRFQILYETNEIYLRLKDASDDSPFEVLGGVVPFNEWSHVSATYDGNIVRLYLNGELIKEEVLSVTLNQGSSDLTIGETKMYNGHWYYWSGDLDNVGYWNRVLTSEEIQSLYTELINGCTDSTALNFNQYAIEDDGSCIDIINGCLDNDYVEFNQLANTDDGSCETLLTDALDSLNSQLEQFNEEAITSLSSLQQALDTWNTKIDLSAGWNMFGYGCPSSIDVAEGLSNHTESIIITKDNNGNVYMPEFGFNGIGDFAPGFGYQIKLTEAIEGFSLCDWYVNDIPEYNIVSLQEEVENLQSELDCYENPQVGDYCFGGIVFYIDYSGERGLVAALVDLEGTYSWGCYDTDTLLANLEEIGTGYQNTIELVEFCAESAEAANTVLAFESDDYSDWYLPSKDELFEMYNSIGDNNFSGWYWSSTKYQNYGAWTMNLNNGNISQGGQNDDDKIRAIRAFGNWTMGCIDSLACNYNPEANMADASCEYPEEGYDCDGYVIAEIGDEFQGGLLFYIDETGQHGLVAAIEDIGEYPWGCYETLISGAEGETIGTGYQNTIDIFEGCSEINTAAFNAVNLNIEGYTDWYLPSIGELEEMYYTIGYGGSEPNIGGFQNNWYWSSSQNSLYGAADVNFGNGNVSGGNKSVSYSVRPIRSF